MENRRIFSHRSRVFAVVYQFGKVASTSLVNLLNEQTNIEAVQSHFLGHDALMSVLESCLNPDVDDFLFYHQSGQLHHNLGITRRINRIISGNEPQTRLVVLLIVREPLDWLRSAVTQYSEGFAEIFHKAKLHRENMSEEADDLTCSSLIELLGQIADVLESRGSIESCLASRPDLTTLVPQRFPSAVMQELFDMTLRPFKWHRQLLEPVFHCTLGDFVQNGDLMSLEREDFDAYLFRFEDFSTALPQLAAKLDLSDALCLPKRNVSAGKPFSDLVCAAFQSTEAHRLARLFRATDYARRFGYCD
jgi:hypothetical protein